MLNILIDILIYAYSLCMNIDCGVAFICRTKMYNNNKSQVFKSLEEIIILQSGKCNKLN